MLSRNVRVWVDIECGWWIFFVLIMVIFRFESYDTILSIVEQIVCRYVFEHERNREVSVAMDDQAEEYKVSVCAEVYWKKSRSGVHDRSRRYGESRRATGGR